MGQVIGTVNVQVGGSPRARVSTISYGGQNSLKSASDLNLSGAADGDVIVYEANTNSFVVQSIGADLGTVDGGGF
jgi:hypothetical protein